MKNITKAHNFFITGFIRCFYGYPRVFCCSALSGNYRVVNLQLLGLPGVQPVGSLQGLRPCHPPSVGCESWVSGVKGGGVAAGVCAMSSVSPHQFASIPINPADAVAAVQYFFTYNLKVWNSAYCARRFRLREPLTRSFFLLSLAHGGH